MDYGWLNIALVKHLSNPLGLTVSQPTRYLLLPREIGFLGLEGLPLRHSLEQNSDWG